MLPTAPAGSRRLYEGFTGASRRVNAVRDVGLEEIDLQWAKSVSLSRVPRERGRTAHERSRRIDDQKRFFGSRLVPGADRREVEPTNALSAKRHGRDDQSHPA